MGEHKDTQGLARGSTHPVFAQGRYTDYVPRSKEPAQMYSPMGGYQRPPYVLGYGGQEYPFYYKFPHMNYAQRPAGHSKGSAEEMQVESAVAISRSVIKTDVVVEAIIHKKSATAEAVPKEIQQNQESSEKKGSGKADKEVKRQEVKRAEKKEVKSPRDRKKDHETESPKQKKKGEKSLEELTAEVKKSLEVPVVEYTESLKGKKTTAPTEDKHKQVEGHKDKKQEDLDLLKLKEILSKRKTTKRAFAYELIMEIGRELKICRRRPVLLAKDLLGRATELYEVSGSPTSRKSQNIERKAEPEEVKKLKMDAKTQLERITEEAKTENDEKEIKFALNKLTPDNYGKQFAAMHVLKSKSDELQKMLVDMLFKKAWREQKYIELYGRLCKDFVCKELGLDPKKKVSPQATLKSCFGAAIVAKLTSAFQKRNEFKEEVKALKQDYTDEEVYYDHRNMLFGSTCRSNDSNEVHWRALPSEVFQQEDDLRVHEGPSSVELRNTHSRGCRYWALLVGNEHRRRLHTPPKNWQRLRSGGRGEGGGRADA